MSIVLEIEKKLLQFPKRNFLTLQRYEKLEIGKKRIAKIITELLTEREGKESEEVMSDECAKRV